MRREAERFAVAQAITDETSDRVGPPALISYEERTRLISLLLEKHGADIDELLDTAAAFWERPNC